MDDRREKLRQYKQAERSAGVYAIRNLRSGRLLIGASMNLDGALNRHRFELDRGVHRSKELLRDWLELGAANFGFETLATVQPSDDPAFDRAAELELLLTLWREEVGQAPAYPRA